MNARLDEKIERGHQLGKKEHQILREAWPAIETAGIDDLWCNKRVGPYSDIRDVPGVNSDKLVKSIARPRCDLIVKRGGSCDLYEISPFLGTGSFGEILVYAWWVDQDSDVPCSVSGKNLLGREAAESILPLCESEGVKVGLVEGPGSIDWVV